MSLLSKLGPGDFARINGQWIQVSWLSHNGSFVRDVLFDDDDRRQTISEPYFVSGDTAVTDVKNGKEYYAGRSRGSGGEFDPLTGGR